MPKSHSSIHKAGPKKDPDNYRGICIMNTLLKILCTMLNDRLTAYSQSHDLIDKEQNGFQKISSTAEHMLTLKALVKKGKK